MAGTGRVERIIAASPEVVYDLVSDVVRTGEWGGECEAAYWLTDTGQPGAVGARFRGHNRVGRARWTRDCEVLVADRGREFTWRTIPGTLATQRDSIRWSYVLTRVPGGTRVVLSHEQLERPLRWIAAVFRVVLPQSHHDVDTRTAGTLDRLADILAGVDPNDGGCVTDDMVLVHRVFRREFGLLPGMVLQVGAGDIAGAARVVAHLEEMIVSLHHHHEGEDEVLWPALRARNALDPVVVDRMETQHDGLAHSLTAVLALAARWAATASLADAEPLATELGLLAERLHEHLTDEEAHILPAAASTLRQAHWDVLRGRGEVALPKRRGLIFLAAILEDADPDEATAFLRGVAPPVRLLHRYVGTPLQRRERNRLRTGLLSVTAPR